jgi:radical SAM protein with 4Fe4S-binding SPASM domain
MNEFRADMAPTRAPAPKSMLLQWHITDRCNGACQHCYQETGARASDPDFDSLNMILAQFMDLLADFDRTTPDAKIPAHVTITGGEPFMRDDILDLVDLLASFKKRFSFAILTNGALIDDRLARFLAIAGPRFVQVSMDGGPQTHDSVRGKGNFELVCAGVRHLVRHGIPTMISFTASSANYRDFPQVARYGQELGVEIVWADRFVPLGQSSSRHDLVLSPSMTAEFMKLISDAALKPPSIFSRRFRVAAGRALQFAHSGGKPYFCKAGRSLLTVLSNGDLVPCRRMPIKIGNLFNEDLRELYWNHKTLHALRSRNIPAAGCEHCPHAGSCRGGLRCLAYALSGSFSVADPGCWMASSNRSK